MNVHFARITLSIRVAVLTLLLLLSSVWSPGLSKTDHQRTIDPWVQLGKLTTSDGAQQDWFGSATAISADTIVIGTAGDDAEQGSAFFVKPVGGWTAMSETAKLTASDGDAS